MQDYGYIKHAMMLLTGIDEETGLAKVHPDNFLTKEQIKAVQDLVTFVKMYIKFAENSESDLGLTVKPVGVSELLDILKLPTKLGLIDKDDWVNNCRLFVATDHGDLHEAYNIVLCPPNFPTDNTYHLCVYG